MKGNLVELGGVQIGQVTGFEVTDDGQAEVEFDIEEDYAPLPVGSRFVIRPGSLSSVANRYIEVHLPSADAADAEAGEQEMLEEGAVIPSDRTTSVVEIDTFFSMFDKKTRESIQGFFRGGAAPVRGRRRRRQPRPALPQDEPVLGQPAVPRADATTRRCSSGSSRTPRASSRRSPRRRASSARSSTT